MNAREKLESAAVDALKELGQLAGSSGATAPQVMAAAEVLKVALAVGVFGTVGPTLKAPIWP